MSRFWSILFFLVPILGVVTFSMATLGIAPLETAGLPKSFSLSGDRIAPLFNGIHLLCAVVMLGTGFAIGWALWKFDHRRAGNDRARYFKSNTKLEIIWTVIPAIILVFLAFFQLKPWSENQMDRPMILIDGQPQPVPPIVLVKAKRFGWEFHYAGADGLVETQDDMYIENLLVLPYGEDVVLQMESRDVIHSFFVPELRLKQDIVPGMTQFAWFNAREPGEMEVMCTEFCGWGHYIMKADLRLVGRAEFDKWLADKTAEYSPEFEIPEPDLAQNY